MRFTIQLSLLVTALPHRRGIANTKKDRRECRAFIANVATHTCASCCGEATQRA
jgi:hypothetical protein